MGADFLKAALAAGHGVVATGRDRARVCRAFGASDDLLPVALDVTSRSDARAEAARLSRQHPICGGITFREHKTVDSMEHLTTEHYTTT